MFAASMLTPNIYLQRAGMLARCVVASMHHQWGVTACLPLILNKSPTWAVAAKTFPMYSLNPIDLVFAIANSPRFQRKMQRGMAEFVDTPTELWQSRAWGSSIRSTSGEFPARVVLVLSREFWPLRPARERTNFPADSHDMDFHLLREITWKFENVFDWEETSSSLDNNISSSTILHFSWNPNFPIISPIWPTRV